jgi:HSP20 family protein
MWACDLLHQGRFNRTEMTMAPPDPNSTGRRGWFTGGTFDDFQRDVNRFFDDMARDFRGVASRLRPTSALRLDVHESENELCVVADLPGVAPEDVEVRVDGNMLTVSAERRSDSEQQQASYHMMERGHGFMRRTVQLPFAPDPDSVRANCDNGVLTVRMPKHSGPRGGRRIDVTSTGTARSATPPPAKPADDHEERRAMPAEGPGTVAAGAV